MRVLCIYRHYQPDTTPYASALHATLQRLVADGHEVTTCAAQPSYHDLPHRRQPSRQDMDGVLVHRVSLLPARNAQVVRRAINVLIFLTRAVWFSLRRGKYDLVIGSSYPPVMMGAALRLIRGLTGAPYLYHCHELHPECAKLAGKIRWSFLNRWLAKCELRNRRSAERIVVPSKDLRDTILSQGISAQRVKILNNFSTQTAHASSPSRAEQPCEPLVIVPLRTAKEPARPPLMRRARDLNVFRILFAGNLGSTQALHRIIDAAHILYDKRDIQFIFMGQGAERTALQRQAGALAGRTTHFIDHQKSSVAFSCMQYADLGIISLNDGVFRVAFPGTMMTYLAAGLPILAVVEAESALAKIVQQHELGYVTPNTTPEVIAKTILVARNAHRAGESARLEQVQAAAQQLFGKAGTLDKWSQLVNEMDSNLCVRGVEPTAYDKDAALHVVTQRRAA